MKIALKLILLSTIIFISYETVCTDETETCNIGDSCSFPTKYERTEEYYCDPEKAIICSPYNNKCGCYSDDSNPDSPSLSIFSEKENKCCLIPGSLCEVEPKFFLDRCCERETCVHDDGSQYENDGKCQCNPGYTFNEKEKICQKTVAEGETCDGVYEICATDQKCENKKCIKTASDAGDATSKSKTDSNEDATSKSKTDSNEPGENTDGSNNAASKSKSVQKNSNPEDESSFAKNINFKFIFLFVYLCVFNF